MVQVYHRRRAAFTLVEIMIVVAIIGLLAALAMPSFAKARRKSRVDAFAEDLRIFSDSLHTYATNYGHYPTNSDIGQLPGGMNAEDIAASTWLSETPMGGGSRWDYDEGAPCNGCKAAITARVGSASLTAEDWLEIDKLVDDGDLSTGNFRVILGDRYSYVLEW